jgi:hypothetical protein
MRRLLGLLAVSALTVGLVPAAALASHSDGQGPAKDFVTGTLKLALPTALGTYPAQIHDNGSSTTPTVGVPAQGHFFLDIFSTPTGTVSVSGDIVCLTAVGNQAWVRAVVVDSNTDIAPPGFGLLSRVVDNGEGGTTPDAASALLVPPPGANPNCPSMPFETTNSTSGNATVHDGI